MDKLERCIIKYDKKFFKQLCLPSSHFLIGNSFDPDCSDKRATWLKFRKRFDLVLAPSVLFGLDSASGVTEDDDEEDEEDDFLFVGFLLLDDVEEDEEDDDEEYISSWSSPPIGS